MIGSFKFFSKRNGWKEIPMCILEKHMINFFYMEAKILDINKQSSNENFNVIFSPELYIELIF